jgi:LPS sulfotransferase NodH
MIPVRCMIMFTARSGSSRVTDILRQSRVMGRAGEFFNPAFVKGIGRTLGARDFEDYVSLLVRGHGSPGAFTCEATYHHVRMAFGKETELFRLVQPNSWAWLIRRDIVAQAVSGARVVATGVAHDTGLDSEELHMADERFAYDGAVIARRLVALRYNEILTEAMFRRHGLAPLRLCYETLSGMPAQEVARLFARHLGVPLPKGLGLTDHHRKLGTGKSSEFADRFRRRNRWFVAALERGRDKMLARLQEFEG